MQTAFKECDAEDFLLVQLAHANGLYGREMAQMFGSSDAAISRTAASAQAKSGGATVAYGKGPAPCAGVPGSQLREPCRAVGPARRGGVWARAPCSDTGPPGGWVAARIGRFVHTLGRSGPASRSFGGCRRDSSPIPPGAAVRR